MIDTILFDLDGTLTPIGNETFVNAYFGNVAKRFYEKDAKKLLKDIMIGTEKMINNDGSQTNDEAFWKSFTELGYESSIREEFEDFYKKEFNNVSQHIEEGYNLRAYVDDLKAKGYDLVLATNPIFPHVASVSRLAWIGLDVGDFSYITTMENSSFIKPKEGYYKQILEVTGKKAEQCIMVGNDVRDDMSAKNVGMKVFLLPKYLENKENEDISNYPNGDFTDLISYLEEINA